MKNVNLTVLSGNIGQIKNLGTVEKPFVAITLAVKDDYKEKVAKTKNEDYTPDWHDVNFNGNNARFIIEHLNVGDYVLVQGALTSSFYTPQGYDKKIKTWTVQADDITLLKSKKEEQQG